MKPIYVTLSVGLVCAGLGIWMHAAAGAYARDGASPNTGTDPVHPITHQMVLETGAMARGQAADFALQDASGKTQTLDSLANGKPLFLYFILDGCPCSTDAEPLFHDLYRHLQGSVSFAGVIGSDRKVAAIWSKRHEMPYPILADPTLKAVHSYGAKHSTYCCLITPDHKIDAMWPGYSQDMLLEMNARLSLVAGVPDRPFDTKYAPLKPTSGCFFPG